MRAAHGQREERTPRLSSSLSGPLREEPASELPGLQCEAANQGSVAEESAASWAGPARGAGPMTVPPTHAPSCSSLERLCGLTPCGARSQSGSADSVQIKTAGGFGSHECFWQVIDLRFCTEDVAGQESEPQPVAFPSAGEREGLAKRDVGRPAGARGLGRAGAGEPQEALFTLWQRLEGVGRQEGGGTEARLPHTRPRLPFSSQGKSAMRTPLRELMLQPGALNNSGEASPVCSSLTPSLCKLGLQVRSTWTTSPPGCWPTKSSGEQRAGTGT